ncbi:MAG: class I tRNA ligase family protein, partial [Candidatus Aenigmatarchaeota archaeon]
IEKVTEDIENFRLNSASRSLADFILNDFSRWYIKLIRDRVSPWYEGSDKKPAQITCRYVLYRLVRLMAPITPFISERIHTRLFKEESVQLSKWPKPERKMIDTKLEEQMKIVDSLIEAVNFARQEAGIKLKWPVLEIHVLPKDKKTEEAVKRLSQIIQKMGNVRNVRVSQKLGNGRKFEYGEFVIGEVLMNEALVRELVRKVQMLRKEDGLKVTQRISLFLETDPKTQEKLHSSKEEIVEGVGADSLRFEKLKREKGVLEFEGSRVRIWFDVKA